MSEWKLVPVEPTEEMLRAGVECKIWLDPEITKLKGYAKQRLKTIPRWKAMLEAAPPHPTTQKDGISEEEARELLAKELERRGAAL